MTDDNSKTGLSRRKMLGGIGMIGVASAGAGLGTTAYFSDRTSFRDNHLEAGQLELFVDFNAYEFQGPEMVYHDSGIVSGKDTISIDVDDVKPGDWAKYKLCFDIVDNPAYLWLCGALTENNLGDLNRPKKKALAEKYGDDNNDNIDFDDIDGQLADALDVIVYYCTPDEDIKERADPDEDDIIAEGSLAEVLATLQGGVPLDADGETDDGDGQLPLADRNCFPPAEEVREEPGAGPEDEQCVCFEWSLSTDVGNKVQNDSVKFDFEVFAEQCRHNDGTTNPCVDEVYTEDYINPEGISQPIEGGSIRVGVSYGPKNVVYNILFDEPEDADYSLSDPDFANANFSLPFNADPSDGTYDFQVAWNEETPDGFDYSGVESGPNWEKDTSTGWSPLPPGFFASKSGKQAIISVPREELDQGDDDYVFGFNAGAGGEQPFVGIPEGGPYSSSQNFTSDENGQTATLL